MRLAGQHATIFSSADELSCERTWPSALFCLGVFCWLPVIGSERVFARAKQIHSLGELLGFLDDAFEIIGFLDGLGAEAVVEQQGTDFSDGIHLFVAKSKGGQHQFMGDLWQQI